MQQLNNKTMMQNEQTAAAIASLTGGFQWKPEWRKQLPVVRGIYAPKMEPLDALWTKVPTLRDGKDYGAKFLDDLFNNSPWHYPRAAAALALMQQVAQGPHDRSFWLEAMAQAAGSEVIDYLMRHGDSYGKDHVDKERRKTG